MTPERRNRLTNVINKRQPAITVVLENVADPHNISAVMRTCDSVGIQEIYILNNAIPKHKKWGTRSSSSAAKWLTIHQFENTQECFEAVSKKFDHIYATHLSEKAVSLYELDLTKKVALVFGNEHSGITDEALKYCHGNYVIPQFGIIKSLNISVACAVSIYEALRQKTLVGHFDKPQLSNIEQENLMRTWEFGSEETTEF